MKKRAIGLSIAGLVLLAALMAGFSVYFSASRDDAIYNAISADNSREVARWIAEGNDVNAPLVAASPKYEGGTPLHYACHYWSPNATDELLAAGADPELMDNNGLPAPFMVFYNNPPASVRGRELLLQTTQILLKHKISFEMQTRGGELLFWWALDMKIPELSETVLKSNLDVNHELHGETFLDRALAQKHPEQLIQMYRQYGAKTTSELKAEKMQPE